MTDQERAGKIRALLEERHGYEVRGLTGSVSEVDEQLRLLGAQGATPVKRAAQRVTGADSHR